jgi:hypothetical protein
LKSFYLKLGKRFITLTRNRPKLSAKLMGLK